MSSQKQSFGMKGFGYDSVSDDYKVVNISCDDQFYGNVYVYNLRTNTWKEATHSPYRPSIKSWTCVFVNGFLHWMVYSHSKSKLVIVAFSLADEKLSELSPPNEVDIESEIDIKLVALGEKLAIFNEVKGDVWLMNEYG
ncbi:F-box associated domain containing protein, partial [Tanacetum coccineum]